MKGTELTMEWREEGDTQTGLLRIWEADRGGGAKEGWHPFNIKAPIRFPQSRRDSVSMLSAIQGPVSILYNSEQPHFSYTRGRGWGGG